MQIKNPINQSSRFLFTLSLIWAGVLLLIGVWWIYLIFHFEHMLMVYDRARVTKMIVWEGGSFIVLLLLLSCSLFVLFLKDQRKTKALQEFFASLTHELKTPLASIRLQSEVINEILATKNDSSINKLSNRLIEDTAKLEMQMDKILQLSRLERGGALNLTSLKLIPTIKSLAKIWARNVELELTAAETDVSVVADEFALELILKNLFENTRIHTKSKKVFIHVEKSNGSVIMTYQDEGEFNGNVKKLGTLFYKFNSGKGSGIGLYLSHKLLSKMGGQFEVTGVHKLKFILNFKSGEDFRA